MKDWKGNSASVRSRLAIKADHTTKGREENDFYATDPKALERLMEFTDELCNYTGFVLAGALKEIDENLIWEPAAGMGNLSNYLKEHGYNVVASDLRIRGAKGVVEGIDFLQVKDYSQEFKGVKPYVILTNPPYSLATEFIEHALELLPDGGLYIALMNISYLAGQKRFERVYSKGVLCEVYIFSKRIECWRNNDRETYGGKAMVDFAWFVFQKGYNGQPILYWL